jgi:hypothetical protein
MIPLPRFCLLLGLAAASFAGAGPARADEYSCGSITSGHCYGVTTWEEQPQYFGAYTDIAHAPLSCVGCDGFVTNELWVVDNASPACTASPRRKCWVEAGYFNWNGLGQDTHFFWADSSPSGQLRVTFLDRAGPWTLNHFMIVQDARAICPGPFRVWIYNTSLSTLFSAESSSFTANRVIMGQELTGTQGLSAETATFERNIWAVQPLGPEYVFWYEPQRTEGWVRFDAPPWARWSASPDDPLAPEGGTFATRCCR